MGWLMQVEVTTGDGPELTTMITWVDRKVKPGNVLLFKRDDRYWTVTQCYENCQYREIVAQSGSKWNNNI